MSQIYRCRRCKQLVELSGRKDRIWMFRLTEWSRNDLHESWSFDLCPDCARKAMDFIRGEE